MSSRDDLGRPNEQLNLRSWADIVGKPESQREKDMARLHKPIPESPSPIKGSPRVFHRPLCF